MLAANTHKEEDAILDNAKKQVQKAWIQRLDSANKDDEAAEPDYVHTKRLITQQQKWLLLLLK
jgi:hypothetical protein